MIHLGTIFKGLATSEIRVSYGRVAFFLIFRRLNTRSDFASILGGSWEGFERVLDIKNGKTGVQEGSKDDVNKEDKTKKNEKI